MRKRAATRGTEWTDAELLVLFDAYPEGGSRAVRALLPTRSLSSIKNTAERYGVGCGKAKPEDLDAAPLPRMDLLESLDCVRLRNWRGPVAAGPLRWAA